MILANIPTNVITGFLGAGKTTFIQALLKAKPAHETWAVLVNEFGEIGIDAALMQGSDSVVIREVPGGCLCCAAGVPLQVAVTQLLAKAKPDRLIIEPTGLGHPQQIIKLLSSSQFQQLISLQRSCCVVDPRNLLDTRYTEHDTFLNQLRSSDLWLLSKADTWSENLDLNAALAMLPAELAPSALFRWSQQQPLDSDLLAALQQPRALLASQQAKTAVPAQRALANDAGFGLGKAFNASDADETSDDFDASGIIFKQQHAEGHYSYGWRFSPAWIFEFAPLMAWVKAQDCERLKAVMLTDEGVIGINQLQQQLNLSELDDAMESRIELISRQPLDAAQLQQSLMACRWLESYSS
ncbi:GTP-binding protein [Shewanella avicenniae]|uniref:GTP-binding protein n=1 Tax=Shewanella avicenniae TaxID=2814294 RepID=A0ABX7QNP4_9GAMM|nr:GTP-binding protein [Shewanella avicenniae]QSX32869.1 GTP-binding protein [Shewanella avicenniae]